MRRRRVRARQLGAYRLVGTPIREREGELAMSRPPWLRSLLCVVIGLAVGAGLIAAGIEFFKEYQAGRTWQPTLRNQELFSSPLLAAVTLFLGGVVAAVVGLGAGLNVLGEISPGCFWKLPKGPFLLLIGILSLLLPPLFLWQAWVILCEFIRLWRPPFFFFRIGGAMSDWVIFFCLGLPLWLLVAIAGSVGPVALFREGLQRPTKCQQAAAKKAVAA
jgi:hypothetical protein